MRDEPLERLAACHERIEAQLEALERLPRSPETARAVMRYFDTSGAMHHRDEDEDLFPLLRELAAARGRREIAAAIDELEREHASMHALWGALRKRLESVARGEGRLEARDVERFAWLYRRHMDREAAAVLPFAREALSASQRAALAERMDRRRA